MLGVKYLSVDAKKLKILIQENYICMNEPYTGLSIFMISPLWLTWFIRSFLNASQANMQHPSMSRGKFLEGRWADK